MGRPVLIVNPSATAVTPALAEAVARALRVSDVRFTERPGHASELARAACRAGARALYVLAGDGGFNEVLNGADATTPLGFLPGGGTSVLPRALGLPRDPLAAARRLLAARARRISVGRVNGRRFGFAAGVGVDAELVRRADALTRAERGRRAGDLAFLAAAARLLAERGGRLDPALEVRGLGRAACALVANGDPYTYLGPLPLRIAPAARFELGLDLVAPRAATPASLPRLLARAALGRGWAGVADVLSVHDVDRIELVCERPLPLQADGEDLGDVREATFEAEREAVLVLV